MISPKKIVARLRKKHKDSSARIFSDLKSLSVVPGGISTQCLALDIAIGRPGVPRGRLTEIAGLEASSKSTLGEHIIAETQRRGGLALLIESESAYDIERARAIGVNVDELVIAEPKNMEDGFEIIEEAIVPVKPGDLCCVVWDSIAGTQTAAEEEADYDESQMGSAARVLARGLRKLMPIVAEKKVALVFINQMKTNIGGYGPQYASYGGFAIRYHASLRVQLKKRETEVDVDVPVGIWVNAFTNKNKIAKPFQEADFLVLFENGIDRYQDMLDTALDLKVFTKRGGWYSYKDKRFVRRKVQKVIKEEFGGLQGCRKFLLQQAKAKGLIRSYGEPK